MIEGENLTKILQHDLKTPVSGILSLAQLIMLEGGGNHELREYAQNIYDRGQRMLILMDNLMDLEQISRSAFELRREPLIINTLVDQVQRDYERPMKLKGISLRVRIQGLPWGAAPLLTFWGKENLVWGILENSIRNAIEASPSGSTVEVKVDLQGEEFRIEVENEGEVPFEIRDRFFEPFTSTKPDGVGLGTYTIKQFSVSMEGTAEFKTGEGRTKVVILLPQKEGHLTV